MRDEIINEILESLDMKMDTFIELKTLYGFTFVFKTRIIHTKGKISSAEIKPLGIIYDENDQYYFAPLDEVDNIDEIVKEYVEKYLR